MEHTVARDCSKCGGTASVNGQRNLCAVVPSIYSSYGTNWEWLWMLKRNVQWKLSNAPKLVLCVEVEFTNSHFGSAQPPGPIWTSWQYESQALMCPGSALNQGRACRCPPSSWPIDHTNEWRTNKETDRQTWNESNLNFKLQPFWSMTTHFRNMTNRYLPFRSHILLLLMAEASIRMRYYWLWYISSSTSVRPSKKGISKSKIASTTQAKSHWSS